MIFFFILVCKSSSQLKLIRINSWNHHIDEEYFIYVVHIINIVNMQYAEIRYFCTIKFKFYINYFFFKILLHIDKQKDIKQTYHF